MNSESLAFEDWLRALRDSQDPDIDKLGAYFDRVTGTVVDHAAGEIELAKALDDAESRIKAQIKLETMTAARRIFAEGFHLATGHPAWNDEVDG